MPTTVTRTQLYDLVWSKTMRDAARDLSVSDSGLRNICLKHGVPTPRAGYWMKVAHGKNVQVAPLPNPDDDRRILIFGHGGPADTEPMANARGNVLAALERVAQGGGV